MALTLFSPSTKIKSADVNANFAGLADGSNMSTPTIANATLSTKFVATGIYNNGNSGSTYTVYGTNGDRQKITISASTTLSWSGFVAGQIVVLQIIENGTGGYTIALPSGKWSYGATGTFDTTANAINLLSIFYDGTYYYYQLAPSMS